MQFTVSKNKLLSGLQDVSHAIGSNSPIPFLKGILVQVKKEGILLLASDNDLTIQRYLKASDINLKVVEEGDLLLESKYLLDIVRKIDGDTLSVNRIDGSLTLFKGVDAQFRMNGMNPKEYPNIDLETPSTSLSLSDSQLAMVIDQTIFACGDPTSRPILSGIHFIFDTNGFSAIATDSYRLAKKTLPLQSQATMKITIPAKTLQQVKSIVLSQESKDLKIFANDKKIQFVCGDILIQSRLLEGEYPDVNRLIPSVFSQTLTVSKSYFISVLDRSLFIQNENKTVNRLQCDNDRLLITNRSQEIGEFEQHLDDDGTSYQGDALDISFQASYVIQAARSIPSDTLTIRFNGDMHPFVLGDEKDDSLLQLILPLRTYN